MGLIKQNKGFEINLLYIDYKLIGIDENSTQDYIFIIQDDYDLDNFNEDSVSIILTRKVYYKPETLFNISVTLRIAYNINKESKQKLNKENLVEELKSKKKTLLSPLLSRASLLIANITNANDNLNVITPPFLQK